MDELERYLQQIRTDLPDNGSRLLRDVAYERLRDAIRHTGIPGQPLSETRISKALGISRTPVREALQQLAQEGLVQVIPGRAVTVAEPSVREVLDVIHVRMLLEPELMRLITESGTAQLHTALHAVIHRMHHAAAANDKLGWSEADTEYHDLIAAASPNPLLGELVSQMRNRLHFQASVDSRTNPERLIACTLEHEAIVTMIVGGDADGAEAATEQHLRMLRQSLFARLGYHAL